MQDAAYSTFEFANSNADFSLKVSLHLKLVYDVGKMLGSMPGTAGGEP